ncbi:hypothetical protein ACFL6S_11580 [Candidatus Poribacteria bacterium]
MKLFSVFDTYASSYEVKDAIAELQSIKGVNSIEAMERVAGEVPRYCLAYDIDNTDAEKTIERIRQAASEYSSYVSNSAWGAYKKIG